MVIEDDFTARQLLQRYLSMKGFEVLLAVDGVDGVERFRERADSIDLVVFDLFMPNMDGDDAMRLIREHRPDVPAIVTSGCAASVVTERLSDIEVAETFFKPFHLRTLGARIQEVLSER